MSDVIPGGSSESKKVFIQELKDKALFFGWIGGLVLIGAVAWTLSRPVLFLYLGRSVNQTMVSSGESLRLSAEQPLPPVKQSPLGVWYSIENSNDLFFVFPVFQDGILCLCGARLSPENTVSEIIPVSAHASQVFNRLPPGILKIYVRRIENSAAQRRKNE